MEILKTLLMDNIPMVILIVSSVLAVVIGKLMKKEIDKKDIQEIIEKLLVIFMDIEIAVKEDKIANLVNLPKHKLLDVAVERLRKEVPKKIIKKIEKDKKFLSVKSFAQFTWDLVGKDFVKKNIKEFINKKKGK